MVTAAHRYCLGRQSYIVGACIEWLSAWWDSFDDNTKAIIIRDTVEALQDNMAGSYLDKEAWLYFATKHYEKLDEANRMLVRDNVGYRNKPWPLRVL